MKKSKLEQHNTNAADKIFLAKEIIMAVQIQICLKLLVVFHFLDDFTAM